MSVWLRPARLAIGGFLIAVTAGIVWIVPRVTATPDLPILDVRADQRAKVAQTVGLCGWRDPEADLHEFFPQAIGHRDENVILSAHQLELKRLLNRPLTGDDTNFQIHRVLQGDTQVGTVITRRVKGESGVIELALGVAQNGQVVGLSLQRLREPDDVAKALLAPTWRRAFQGKTAQSTLAVGQDIPDVPTPARRSAQAIATGVREALIVLHVADATPKTGTAQKSGQ